MHKINSCINNFSGLSESEKRNLLLSDWSDIQLLSLDMQNSSLLCNNDVVTIEM